MGWLEFILLAVLVAVVALLVMAMLKSDELVVTRKATIAAPADRVFAEIADFRAWAGWSPWEKKDVAMKKSYGQLTAGRGATYAWEGNNKVGKGSMTIIDSSPPTRLMIKLVFEKPFKGENTSEFQLARAGTATEITWTMRGNRPFIGKLMDVLMNMDRMIGADFESGLEAIKRRCEAR